MKKTMLLLLTVICLNQLCKSQDIIILNNGDSIKCAITKMDSNLVYINMVTKKNQTISTMVIRDSIKDMKIPVLPNNPTRLKYEKKVRSYSTLGIVSGMCFIAGSGLMIYGFKKLNDAGADVNISGGSIVVEGDNETDMSGMQQVIIGLPFAAAGAILGTISLTKIAHYNRLLRNMSNLSVNLNYYPKYKGITIAYRF